MNSSRHFSEDSQLHFEETMRALQNFTRCKHLKKFNCRMQRVYHLLFETL
jgi:hypothetical protein